jgi:hypothetical protein
MNIVKHVNVPFEKLNSGVNRVTGHQFSPRLDPVEPRKRIARAALRAREWFAVNGPDDLQPLPLSEYELMSLKNGGLLHMLALYAQSLAALNYDYKRHPSFDEYARGLMATAEGAGLSHETFRGRNPERRLETFEEMQARFPPRVLPGLQGYYWKPVPKCRQHARVDA